MSSSKLKMRTVDQETSEDEVSKVIPKTTLKFKQRLLKRDQKRFNKYIQSTTTHGVVYIFIGKSKIRRLFWLLIVLTAAIVCLYNVINRIVFLANGPASTTISVTESVSVNFPAVTVCNLNLMKRSFLESISPRLGELIREAFYAQWTDLDCSSIIKKFDIQLRHNQSFADLLWFGRHTVEETIISCTFMGHNCNSSHFLPVLTYNGVCYTFNSGRLGPILKANGTGNRYALSLIVGITQDEYNAALNHDSGIKIAIHPQSEPPRPDELGIAVAPGKNAFISVRQRNIEDKSSKRKCRDTSDTTSFNFLQEEFPYSVSACQIDCLITNIAQNCNCLGSITGNMPSATKPEFHNLSNCTIEAICCQVAQISNTYICDCHSACRQTVYTMATSYSAFPAKYAARDLAEDVKTQFNYTVNTSIFQENFLGVNIYFESLTLEEWVTNNVYDVVALLSDIGGQLGLFLGASVISVFEFVVWLVDEAKDRCCGTSEKKIRRKFESCITSITNKHMQEKELEDESANNPVGYPGVNHYREFENPQD